MRRLICTFVVRIWHKQVFSHDVAQIINFKTKWLVRTYEMFVYSFVQQDSTDPALAWHTMVELRGSSTIQVTFEWQQIYDQALHDLGVTRKYQIAGYLQLVAEMMKKNMGLPIRDKKFILTGWVSTVMILSFRTDMPGQTVQTQIRLVLEEQSDQRGAV